MAALATCFVFCEIGIVQAGFFRVDGPLPWAVAFDLLCTLPAAYVWFVLRPAGRPWLELTPVLIFGIACTGLLLRGVPALQTPLHVFAATAELTLIGAFVVRIVSAFRTGTHAGRDLVFVAQQQRELLLRIAGLELSALYFAFRRTRAAESGEMFDNHRPAQSLLLGLGVVTVMEAVPLHFLLQAWKPVVAWVVLGLTLYSLCWIAGASRALGARPHILSADTLLVRVGLFYTVVIERDAIVRAALYEAAADTVSLKFIDTPNIQLELSAPVRVYGPFGRQKTATRLAFFVEQPDALLSALRRGEPAAP